MTYHSSLFVSEILAWIDHGHPVGDDPDMGFNKRNAFLASSTVVAASIGAVSKSRIVPMAASPRSRPDSVHPNPRQVTRNCRIGRQRAVFSFGIAPEYQPPAAVASQPRDADNRLPALVLVT
jgi:hypothetical protein